MSYKVKYLGVEKMKRSRVFLMALFLWVVAFSGISGATLTTSATKMVYESTYSGNPSFPFTFRVFNSSELSVSKVVIATGLPTYLTKDVDYTVYLAADGTGYIRLRSALASGYRLVIMRNTPFLQPQSWMSTTITSNSLSNVADRITMLAQMLKEQGDRSLKIGPHITATMHLDVNPEANKLIGWDSLGTGLKNYTCDTVQITSPASFDTIGNYDDNLTQAARVIGSTPRTLLLDTVASVDDNVTIPSTLTLFIIQGGGISVAAGKTLSMAASPEAGHNDYQIFWGGGSVSFSKPVTVSPKWWGAPNNGTDSDTAAVQAAYNSLSTYTGGQINIYPGNWVFNVVSKKYNVFFNGGGAIYNGESSSWAPDNETAPVITIGGWGVAESAPGNKISNFVLKAKSANSAKGIWLHNTYNSVVDHFSIIGFGRYSIRIGDPDVVGVEDIQINRITNGWIRTGTNISGNDTFGIEGAYGVNGGMAQLYNKLDTVIIWGPFNYNGTANATGSGALIMNPLNMVLDNTVTQVLSANMTSITIPDVNQYVAAGRGSAGCPRYVGNGCYFEITNTSWSNIRLEQAGNLSWWYCLQGSAWGANGWFQNNVAASSSDPLDMQQSWNFNPGQPYDDVKWTSAYQSSVYTLVVDHALEFRSMDHDPKTVAATKKIYPIGRSLYFKNDNGTIVFGSPTNSEFGSTVWVLGQAEAKALWASASGASGIAVSANNADGTSIESTTESGDAVTATATTTGRGIVATVVSNDGVRSISHSGNGVYGKSSHGQGGYFTSDNNGTGLYVTHTADGVAGSFITGAGVALGTQSTDGYAIYSIGYGTGIAGVFNSENGTSLSSVSSGTGTAASFSANGTGTALIASGNETIAPTAKLIGLLDSQNDTTATAAGLVQWGIYRNGDLLKILHEGAAGLSSVSVNNRPAEDNSTQAANTKYVDYAVSHLPVDITTVGTSRVVANNSEYVICTNTCSITPLSPAAGRRLCARNGPGVTSTITLVNIANTYYEKTDHTGWQANANYKLVSGGAATDSICLIGYDSTHYAILSSTGTWSSASP